MRKYLLIFVILLGCSACAPGNSGQTAKGPEVCFEQHCFEVELATNQTARAKGLMFREQMDADRGMLFIFEKPGFYPFWMKNTLIPLDMIWIDEHKKVVDIAENVEPCKQDPCPKTPPTGSALYVLELNAGVAKTIGLKIGDTMNLNL